MLRDHLAQIRVEVVGAAREGVGGDAAPGDGPAVPRAPERALLCAELVGRRADEVGARSGRGRVVAAD